MGRHSVVRALRCVRLRRDARLLSRREPGGGGGGEKYVVVTSASLSGSVATFFSFISRSNSVDPFFLSYQIDIIIMIFQVVHRGTPGNRSKFYPIWAIPKAERREMMEKTKCGPHG